MNHLNSSDLETAIIQALQNIQVKDPNFFFTNRLSILTWKSKKVKGALVTKVGNLRYLGMLRQDSKGQSYWKYKLLTTPEQSGELSSVVQTSSSANPPAPTKNEVPTSSISSKKGLEESEQVKKFREKYGEFSVNASQQSK